MDTITREVEVSWEGDEMRPGNNIRSSVITLTFAAPKDAEAWKGLPDLLAAEEIVTGTDRGTYHCQILEAAEDGDVGAMDMDMNVYREIKRCFQEVEVENIGHYKLDEECPYVDWVKIDVSEARYRQTDTPDVLIKERIKLCV